MFNEWYEITIATLKLEKEISTKKIYLESCRLNGEVLRVKSLKSEVLILDRTLADLQIKERIVSRRALVNLVQSRK